MALDGEARKYEVASTGVHKIIGRSVVGRARKGGRKKRNHRLCDGPVRFKYI